jgi:hypothetical protein
MIEIERIERIEIIIVRLNDRLTIQENEFVHLKTKVETNEIKEKVIIHKMIIAIIKYSLIQISFQLVSSI